jgi:hypothetical protein
MIEKKEFPLLATDFVVKHPNIITVEHPNIFKLIY